MHCRDHDHRIIQRKGYLVEYFRQRLNTGGAEHVFRITDQGAEHLPKLKHLIRCLPRKHHSGRERVVVETQFKIEGMHLFWYRIKTVYR